LGAAFALAREGLLGLGEDGAEFGRAVLDGGHGWEHVVRGERWCVERFRGKRGEGWRVVGFRGGRSRDCGCRDAARWSLRVGGWCWWC